MSYARWGEDSDVYMYHHVNGFIECCGCDLEGGYSVVLQTRTDAVKHLMKHKKEEHKVPRYTIKRLRGEIKTIGEHITSLAETRNNG